MNANYQKAMKMKKILITCAMICVVVLAAASISRPAKASIDSHNWVGALIHDSYDSFYGTSVTAFEQGSAVRLMVNVYSDYWYMGDYRQVNVSAVIVNFDWGMNYTSGDVSLSDPWEIPYGQSHVFSVTFGAPAPSVASNYVTHSYRVYVEHVNASDGEIIDTWVSGGSGFVVFSSNQADAFRARRELESYPYTSIPFLTAQARELLTQSTVASSLGRSNYEAGNFEGAKTHYENALGLLQQAYTNETERWGSFEDTLEGMLKGAEGLLMYQGYAWLIISIGFLLMGIGVIVYLGRRSGSPPQTNAS